MPEPPPSGLLTRYVLENPWPLGVGLILIGFVVAWVRLREERRDGLLIGGLMLALGGVVLALGALVTTAGEHAKVITRQLVSAAEVPDVNAAMGLFASGASFHFGSPRSPGLAMDYIRSRVALLETRWRIDSNRVTMLKGFTESSTAGVVHLACWTDLGGGAIPSQWVLRVTRQEDGTWKIAQLTSVSVAGRDSSPEALGR